MYRSRPSASAARHPDPQRRGHSRIAALPLALALVLCANVWSEAAPLYAQQAAAALEITVVDAASGQPIPGAQVVLDGGRGGLTNPQGVLRMDQLLDTLVTVRVHFLGYAPANFSAPLESGRTTRFSVPLEVEAIPLAGVRAEVHAPRSRELREFYTRARTGTGQYITRAEIEQRRPRDLSELFRLLPGIRLLSGPIGDKPVMEAKASAGTSRNGRAQECAIQYFVDGTPFTPTHNGMIGLDIPLKDIEGIEIYRRGSSVPAKFHRLNNSCGVILIWKKERI
ncbi:MAG: Plug and carboxypeptidase regulatory-like domain-containing protein [Gemmatimonadota bacterium]|nr:Plug and carboxypeptidase regulatory-like domain-containing protein [Gemmatimonadota bacterium]